MKIELITTGSELLLGFVLNTHQQWISRRLADIGLTVARHVAVPDTADAIREAVRDALARSELIITTGGLGPTADDRTRDLIAELLGRKLVVDPTVLSHIESFFESRGRRMPRSTAVQAMVPEGATVLANAHGTAPGLILETEVAAGSSSCRPVVLIMLPGPPRELHPMFVNQVLPWIQQWIGQQTCFVCRILKTTGLGESLVEERIAPKLQPLIERGLDVGYCARVGEVEVRLAASTPDAAALVTQAEQTIRERIGEFIFGSGDEQLESVIVRTLAAQGSTLALAESCTGGLISHRVTNVPGASQIFVSGVVAYSNAAKERFLGVRAETLREHGAVSEATAREMAEGARTRSGADYALSVTGIAGPTGGTPEKPVGTVFIGLAGEGSTDVVKRLNPYDRETFKYVTSQQALDLLRRELSK